MLGIVCECLPNRAITETQAIGMLSLWLLMEVSETAFQSLTVLRIHKNAVLRLFLEERGKIQTTFSVVAKCGLSEAQLSM